MDVEKGVSSPSMEKAALKQQILECAREKVLLSDSSKFGRVSFAKICGIDRFDRIITDAGLDPESEAQLMETEIEWIKA